MGFRSRFILPLADVGKGITPSDGAKLFFTSSGTANKLATFVGETTATKNSNPVIADGNGVFPEIWLEGRYKVILKTKNNVQAWEEDPVVAVPQQEFETVADMVADTSLSIGQFVTVEDYATGRNSGVLFFKVVAGSTGTADGGSFIDLTGSGLQAQQNFPEFITAKMFGAVGDSTISGGGTDDSIALINAYAEAGARQIPFYIGQGAFRFTQQLLWDKEIDVIGLGRGDGAPLINTLLIKDGNFTAISVVHSAGGTIENFALRGAPGAIGTGLEIFKGERVNVSKLLIRAVGNQGMIVRGGNNASYDDLSISFNAIGLAWDGGTGDVGVSANACKITNLDIIGNTGSTAIDWITGAQCKLQAIIQNNSGKPFQIEGADSKGNQFDLYFESNGIPAGTIGTAVIGNKFTIRLGTITDNSTTKTNVIDEHNQAGVDRYSVINMFVNGIRLEDPEGVHTDPTPWQIREVGNVNEHKITIDSEGSAAKPALIEITQSTGSVIDMTLGGEFRPKSFVATLIGTLTSGDATPSVGGANNLLTAGTTTIIDFVDGTIGQTLYIKAKTNITVSHTTEIQLAGAVPYVMTVGDTLVVKLFETGVWTELSRTVI